jgi:curved DNA-binding protein CbpA
MKDYYRVLAIDRAAGQEEIKRAFRRMASLYHPDHNPQNPKEAMVMDTVDAFRNRIAAIGTNSRRMEQMANSTGLAEEARVLIKEVQALETHLEQFERYLKK